jgi:hypothetical protein
VTLRDFVCIAIGELLLAMTFILGVLVGVSMKRKESHDNGNEGTIEGSQGWAEWRDAERR